MAVWVVTGKLGGGKSLVSVSKIRDYLAQGRKVATNLDIKLTGMFGRHSKATCIRLPDKPTVHDMFAIGIGNESYDEEKNGLIVLDELGTWLNSRSWQDKARAPLLQWFVQARKYGWDIIFIVQDVSMIDSQFREGLAELTVFCKRMDRMSVPVIGSFWKMLTGAKLPMPKVHVGRVVYGTSTTDMLVDRWVYRGTQLYAAYDTRQIFSDKYDKGAFSYLPPAYLNARSKMAMTWGNIMRLTKIMWRRFASPVALATGVLFGISVAVLVQAQNQPAATAVTVQQVSQVESVTPDGELSQAQQRTMDFIGRLYISGTYNVTGRRVYVLADLNDPDQRTLLTDRDLSAMGMGLKPVGDCRLDVLVGSEFYPVYCARIL